MVPDRDSKVVPDHDPSVVQEIVVVIVVIKVVTDVQDITVDGLNRSPTVNMK